MSILHAIILGIVQGLTEFFPVSSSGHLGIVPWLFGWDDFGDNESLAKTFDVALHLGTLTGAIAYFRSDLLRLFRAGIAAPFGEGGDDGRIAWLLVVSAVPAAITGVVLSGVIEKLDDELWLTGVMLIVFGLLLLWADRMQGERPLESFRLRDALLMGVGQAGALQPGVSRSGVTITVSRWLAFDRAAAARLSFLMSLPIIAGAGLYSFIDVLGEGGVPSSFYVPFAVGMVSAGVTGYVAVWATIAYVSTRTFTPFVIYRVIVGLGVIGLWLIR